jgi:hypothetical protein
MALTRIFFLNNDFYLHKTIGRLPSGALQLIRPQYAGEICGGRPKTKSPQSRRAGISGENPEGFF